MRREYELTDEQFRRIYDASKPTPVMYLSGGVPMFRSQQENANDAWQRLADELGFDWESVRPSKKGERFFTAEPSAQKDPHQ